MRGVCFTIYASALFLSACSAPAEPAAPLVLERPAPDPGFRLTFPEPAAVPDCPPGGGVEPAEPQAPPPAKAGVVQTAAEIPLKKEPTSEDVLKLQKEVAARHPASDEEKLRLALLQAAAGNLEEAERIVSSIRSKTNRLAPYVEFFLRRELGDHKEAGKLLARFADEERAAAGFTIERAELVSRVRRFRDYTPAENDRVAPGGDVHLYVEPRNFALQRSGDKHTFHLRYEWKLVDDRSVEQAVPAWERASVDEREDRISSNGPAAEFYQSFHLPLPANLAAGRYRVKVTVTDVVAGKSDRSFVPIYVMPVEKSR
ncbi:MAG: hypothetical protein HY293_21340 [Planctomycetes bacterium]|nr:hypothetical protein [Planctomycetota bacterium]